MARGEQPLSEPLRPLSCRGAGAFGVKTMRQGPPHRTGIPCFGYWYSRHPLQNKSPGAMAGAGEGVENAYCSIEMSFLTCLTPSTLRATWVALLRSALVFTVPLNLTTPSSVETWIAITLSSGSL